MDFRVCFFQELLVRPCILLSSQVSSYRASVTDISSRECSLCFKIVNSSTFVKKSNIGTGAYS